MASRRKDGRWAASLLTSQGRKWFYGSTEEEAEAAKSSYQGPQNQAAKGSLGAFVEAVWWPRVKARCKIPTQKRYSDLWRLHIGPRWEDYPIDGITLEECQAWLNEIPLGAKSVTLIREVLANILSLAEKTRRIQTNEVKWTAAPAPPAKRKRRDLDLDKMHALLLASKGTNMEGPVFAAAFLGMRRGEVCGLKVTDLDFKTSTIYLRRTRNKGYEGPLKKRREGEERVLSVTPSIMERIKAWISPGAIYVFSWEGRPVNPDRLTHNMSELCTKAKIPPMRFHDLRAAATSNLRALGVNPWRVMDILGHSSLDTTTIYQDEREEEIRAALGLLSAGIV